MNDNAIKNYAVWARRELMAEVEKRCAWWGVREGADAEADAIDGRVLSAQEREQRRKLLQIAASDGYVQLVERAAYTWFNRLLAIRFMEVNDRLPSHVRVLSAPDGSFEPQCLREALDLPLAALDGAEALRLVQEGDDEVLFRLVFLAQCDELARCMPAVFEPVGSAMELLLPTGLLRADGVVGRLVTDIDEDDWREGVEIVGWMYQYYVSERKDEVFAGFKKGRKAERDSIAPATQLFTPHWIVRYLTENSLGRLWMLNHPESRLAEQMPYYVTPDEEHETQFRRISSPEEITVVDPACGSGHILVYAFELLLQMYRESGYRDRDAVRCILEKNLTGLEISDRAAALASFALTMKACESDGRFLRRGVTPRITVLARVEFTDEELDHLPHLSSKKALLDAAAHLDECGSLLQVSDSDMDAIERDLASLANGASLSKGVTFYEGNAETKLCQLRAELAPLAERYDVVVANPPYMGLSNLAPWMAKWVKNAYPYTKRDLYSCFIVRNVLFGLDRAELGLVTPYTWMFISTYEQLRNRLISENTITSLIQLEYNAFPVAMVPACTITIQKGRILGYKGGYIRLSDFPGADNQAPRVLEALADPECGWFYRRSADGFESIPGNPIAYWISDAMIGAFLKNSCVGSYVDTHLGMATCNNERFLRYWWEPASRYCMVPSYYPYSDDVRQWVPYNKGGQFRKWYGNDDCVVNWSNAGKTLNDAGAVMVKESLRFQRMASWTRVSSGVLAVRIKQQGFLFDMTGPAAFGAESDLLVATAFLNSSVGLAFARIMSASLDYQPGQISQYPLLRNSAHEPHIGDLVRKCISISRSDWDTYETSWDFRKNPIM